MGLKDYIKFIKRWMWLVIVVFIASASTSAAISFLVIEKTYEASASILISRPRTGPGNNNILYNDILPDADLSKVYSRLGQSDTVMEKTTEILKLDYTLEDLRKRVNVVTDEETGIIKISARDKQALKAQQIVNQLINNLKSQAEKIGLVDSMQIIDDARLPESPISPNPALNILIASIAGFFTGVMLAIMLNSLDNTISDISTFKVLTSLQVLGTIPYIKKKSEQKGGVSYYKKGYTNKEEIFRMLRTNILEACKNNSPKVLLVTSPGVSEGKTTVAANLAISLSQLGKKILLIDGNLKKPAVNNLFKLVCGDGLINYLSGGDDAEPAICTEVSSNLHILPGGNVDCNSADMLASDKMSFFLDSLKDMYEMIIIDSPPVLKFADALIFSDLADGIILTVSCGRTTYDMMEKTKEMFATTNKKMLGLVVNNFS